MADMLMFRKMREDEVKNKEYSSFINYEFNYTPALSVIINLIEWGNNRIIKQGGFRVSPIKKGMKSIKEWKQVTDPKFLIKESSYISRNKGKSIVAIHVER